MKSFKQFITEKVIEVDKSDIDMIYRPLKVISQDVLKAWQSGNRSVALLDAYNKHFLKPNTLLQIQSSKLKSPAAKLANEINPITIHVWNRLSTNHYHPGLKEIHLGFTNNASQAIAVIGMIPDNQHKSLHSEFTEIRIKGTIRHELAHWLDNSLNNLHMSKILKAGPDKFAELLKGGQRDVALGHIEIEAVTATIAEIKRRVKDKKYNQLTWDELMDLHPALNALNNRLGAPWRKKLATRLAREGLLGQNMRF